MGFDFGESVRVFRFINRRKQVNGKVSFVSCFTDGYVG